MRLRRIIVSLVVVGVATFGVGAGVASAQTTSGIGEFNSTCVGELQSALSTKSGDDLKSAIEDCQAAPSPIKPANNELIWGAISFVVLFVLLWKLAYPGIKKGMEARTTRIQSSIDEAESAKNEAQSVLDDYRRQLADARNESARIIEEARQQADALKKDQEARLQSELADMRSRAAADVESAKAQALADLRGDVADLAIQAAQVIVQHNLDRDTQIQLIENYINQVGSAN